VGEGCKAQECANPLIAVGLSCKTNPGRAGAGGQTSERHVVVAAFIGVHIGVPTGEGGMLWICFGVSHAIAMGLSAKRVLPRCGADGKARERHTTVDALLGLQIGVPGQRFWMQTGVVPDMDEVVETDVSPRGGMCASAREGAQGGTIVRHVVEAMSVGVAVGVNTGCVDADMA